MNILLYVLKKNCFLSLVPLIRFLVTPQVFKEFLIVQNRLFLPLLAISRDQLFFVRQNICILQLWHSKRLVYFVFSPGGLADVFPGYTPPTVVTMNSDGIPYEILHRTNRYGKNFYFFFVVANGFFRQYFDTRCIENY